MIIQPSLDRLNAIAWLGFEIELTSTNSETRLFNRFSPERAIAASAADHQIKVNMYAALAFINSENFAAEYSRPTRSSIFFELKSSAIGFCRLSCGIFRPNCANGRLVTKSTGNTIAWIISIVPAQLAGAGGAPARHFEVAVRIRVAHPIPRVLQPLGPVFLALQTEPRDFVVAPDPQEFAFDIRLPG